MKHPTGHLRMIIDAVGNPEGTLQLNFTAQEAGDIELNLYVDREIASTLAVGKRYEVHLLPAPVEPEPEPETDPA